MKKRSIILLHVLIWSGLSTLYFFCSEWIIAWLLPDVHDVILWLKMLIAGLMLILILVFVSLVFSLRKRANQANKQK